MRKGKFEAARAVRGSKQTGSRWRLRWPVLSGIVLVLAAAGLTVFVAWNAGLLGDSKETAGFTKEETLQQFRNLARTLESGDMILTLRPDDPASGEEPIILKLTPAQSCVRVDLTGLEADLEEGVGRVSRCRYVVDPMAYISLDRTALRALAEQAEALYATVYLPSFASVMTYREGDAEHQELTLNIGRSGRYITSDSIYNALLSAYLAGDLSPTLSYQTEIPQRLDVDEIYSEYCTAPIDAVMDKSDFSITPDVPGYGFPREELAALLEQAEEGRGYVLEFRELVPDVTAADLEAWLYADILGEAHTPHSWVNDRTVNLILACAEIDGTVVMPGQIFSFNEVVGERTAEKGYREATAYVGGASVPEIGGGVCQVASSIYYSVLQADLRTVERYAHTYLVTYVPEGMDAAIYWGCLDYKFENTSPTPIKIEAGVSEGKVHIVLRGREWKDYSVELGFEILRETPWETKTQYVYDGSYREGETIVSPYTGYKISTYKTLYDLNGNKLETVHIANSTYDKRDKVIAAIPSKPTEPAPQSTSASTGP